MKNFLAFALLMLLSPVVISQGLENIIVEKFYISDANDATDIDGGFLAAGSVTYRIFIDMAPGYILQSVYADPVRFHELRMETTTLFFNNVDRGAMTARGIAYSRLSNNTVMVDSWITLAAASAGSLAVLKSEDTNGAITNLDGFLQNSNPAAGIPIKTADGMIVGIAPQVSTVGLDNALTVLDAVNAGPLFLSTDGAWFNAPGVSGPTAENKVLIAQLTTTGTFSFRINLQMRRESDLKIENYVHSDPTGQEILCTKCNYNSIQTEINETAESIQKVKIFPNPAINVLNVELGKINPGKRYSVNIIDMLGKIQIRMDDTEPSGTFIRDIDITSLPKGLYIVKITSEEGVVSTRRFIKSQ